MYFLLTIPTVIFLFKWIEPKKLASLFAATLFISCSVFVIWGELKNNSKKSFSLWSAMAFLIFFSAPMIVARIAYYDLDFSDINFGPVSGTNFHKYSNYGFMVLLASSVIDYILSKRKIKARL